MNVCGWHEPPPDDKSMAYLDQMDDGGLFGRICTGLAEPVETLVGLIAGLVLLAVLVVVVIGLAALPRWFLWGDKA